ncbi:ankyrin repeat and MYND domain-containing protein 1-like isoform X2 [Ptychodera flava]|uniref:ankyrin repeat and MYND domain-containing protein 1-like isoform X2 n=1 Tax=Ptychodera flava TaxID=63121 RepID=UPI00396A7875
MPSKLEFYTFPRLRSAKREPDDGFKAYKSGASFTGHLEEGIKKEGSGVFVWPNGDRYSGEFADNVRVGKGVQHWADGAKYDGDFLRDMRHGYGEITWCDGESYKGDYFKDRRHGYGTYTWPDGATYTGTFYCDKKEGYGTFVLSNGDKFEGLYKSDEREGPGVQTYNDGRQDVGVWHKERLVKLCTAIDGIFTMKDHPEFDYDPLGHIKHIHAKEELEKEQKKFMNGVQNAEESAVGDLRAELEKIATSDILEFTSFQPSTGTSVDLDTLTYDKAEYDEMFFKENKNNDMADDDQDDGIFTALNNTPSFIDMQRHMYRHRRRQKSMPFDVNAVIAGDRDGFGQKGPIELASEVFIRSAGQGNLKAVYTLLSNCDVDVNVSDKHGNTALLAAAVNMHKDVINCLLDHGADVNKLNNEGISALAACHVFFYPITSFKYNIAEKYLLQPLENEGNEEEGEKTKIGYKDPIADEIEREIENELKRHEDGELDWRDGDIAEIISATAGDTAADEFESNASVHNYGIEVTEHLLDRSATALSTNRRIVSGRTSKCTEPDLGTARILAVQKAEHVNMEATIRLLLRRGADPNASSVPMAVIFFAIKAADVDAVRILLEKGAATSARLSDDKGGLAPLHIASAIPGEEGVEITGLLLRAGADPNVRAHEEDEEEEKAEDMISSTPVRMKPGLDDSVSMLSLELEERGDNVGGRTALHIACNRDDNHKLAQQVVKLLLEYGANPNVLCLGQSPLSLAISSGNDLAIDELLAHKANPSLPLGHGIGSALCAASNTAFEHRRTPQQRIQLIDKLIDAGANILAPIAVGSKRQLGTAVDYAYWMFNLDRRIAHMPYHALTHAERDTYNARRKLLGHMGDLLREAAVRREQLRLEAEEEDGRRSVSPSANFVYTGAGAKVPAEPAVKPKSRKGKRASGTGGDPYDGKQVVFHNVTKDSQGQEYPLLDREDDIYVSENGRSRAPQKRKPLFKYCYECGRSIGVRLSACTRCKEVYYCSKACKLKAWNARHKEECVRIAGRSRSPSPSGKGPRSGNQPGRVDSPTPTTNPNANGKVTVEGLMSKKGGIAYVGGNKSVGKAGRAGRLGGGGSQLMGSRASESMTIDLPPDLSPTPPPW